MHFLRQNLRQNFSIRGGRVAEWSNAPVLKTGSRESGSWVRIPPRPPCFSLMSAGIVGGETCGLFELLK